MASYFYMTIVGHDAATRLADDTGASPALDDPRVLQKIGCPDCRSGKMAVPTAAGLALVDTDAAEVHCLMFASLDVAQTWVSDHSAGLADKQVYGFTKDYVAAT